MKAKLEGWMLAMAAGLLVSGCEAPQKQVQEMATTTAPAPKPERADPEVAVFGLGIRTAKYDEVLKQFRPTQAFGAGTRALPAIDLTLHVATQKYDLVHLDSAVVESFTDSAGHDLSMGMTQTAERLFFPADTNISLDHKHAFLALHFPKPPSPGSRQLTMRGIVHARSGGTPQTLVFDNVPFTKGSKFQVLGHDYTLNNIWSYDSSPNQINFSFTSDGSYDEVRAIRFLSVDGKTVVGNIWRIDRFVRRTTSLLCQVNGETPQAMRIEVDTYENPKDLAIPFQLTLDLGVMNSAEPVKLLATATLPAAPVSDKFKVESQVMQLTMTAPISDQQGRAWFGERSGVATFRRSGLKMQVKLHVPDRRMVRVIPTSGTVLSFTDDNDSSLLPTASVSGNPDQAGVGDMTVISRDGHDALITVATEKIPATGSRELRFKGKIGIAMEDSEKVEEARGVAMLPGTTCNLGGTEFMVTAVRAAGAAGNGMDLEMKASSPIHGTVLLRDENGRQLASAPVTEDPVRRHAEGIQVNMTLAKAVDTATVQLKTTTDEGATSVPVEFTVPIGLQGER